MKNHMYQIQQELSKIDKPINVALKQ